MKRLFALLVLLPALALAQVHTNPSSAVLANIVGGTINGTTIGGVTPAAGSFTTLGGTTVTGTTQFLGAIGNCGTVPGFSFIGRTTDGMCSSGAGVVAITAGGAVDATFSNSGLSVGASSDVVLARDGANILAQKNSTNAQNNRLYFSTTGPVYWQQTARTAGVVYTATGGAAQVSLVQTIVPTVTTNGGTSPSCVGTDTAMICTIGTAPPAAATFTVTFNGTWPAAPACQVIRATTGTTPVVTSAATATTTVVVTLSANLVESEKYAINCMGVS